MDTIKTKQRNDFSWELCNLFTTDVTSDVTLMWIIEDDAFQLHLLNSTLRESIYPANSFLFLC